MADSNNRPATGHPAPASNGIPPPPPQPNTSYPYAAAAAAPPPPSTYYNQQYYPDPDAIRRAALVRRLFAPVIAGIIFLGTIIFIIWLVLRPRLPEFRVDSLSISKFNISSSTISADFGVKITARNPNGKITLFYDNIDAAVFFRNYRLSKTTLPPFSLGKKNETSMTADMAAVRAYVEGDAVNKINEERGKNGNVVLNVRMIMDVRFRAGAWRTRRRYLKVLCGDLYVGVSTNATNGTLTSGRRQCRVGL